MVFNEIFCINKGYKRFPFNLIKSVNLWIENRKQKKNLKVLRTLLSEVQVNKLNKKSELKD